jgi:pimeloyl-ACP methyl ester carboxylesterase
MSYRDVPPGTSRTDEKREFALPAAYFEDQARYDVTQALKECTKPKLFFYGTKDALVSPDSVKAMYETAAPPKMIHELHTEHDYRLDPEAIEEVNKTIGDFLAA